jgi:hypothetical protein
VLRPAVAQLQLLQGLQLSCRLCLLLLPSLLPLCVLLMCLLVRAGYWAVLLLLLPALLHPAARHPHLHLAHLLGQLLLLLPLQRL